MALVDKGAVAQVTQKQGVGRRRPSPGDGLSGRTEGVMDGNLAEKKIRNIVTVLSLRVVNTSCGWVFKYHKYHSN